ncbi:aromatic prenyltransferase [Aspergillus keveii]|uniref:Aromatic prenyltransferase n=1 Tax=Aspergillus keveii TaxID=714993 RepID=A0ABR4FVB2_9EURO
MSTTQTSSVLPPTKAWTRLSQWLPSRTSDLDYWWKLTGSHLAKILHAADYSDDEQVDALLFHYHYIVPYLGPSPEHKSSIKWRSAIGVDGGPFEYSWKWNTTSGKPDVRYTLEAISPFSGTPLDPLNHQAGTELLHRVASVVPSIDLTWTNHFLATLFSQDRSKYTTAAANGTHFTTSMMVAAEWLPSGLSMKTYFVPRGLGQGDGSVLMAQWEESIAQLMPTCPARVALHEFLSTNAEGQLLQPGMLAVDNVLPEKSRLKLYFQTPHTNFTSVREIMTLGGRISVPESQLEDLRTLLLAVSGLEPDFPNEQEIPCCKEYSDKDVILDPRILLSGYVYYFDLAPGPEVPQIKLYNPVRRYGPNDRALAEGLTKWMASHGRGEYCGRYISVLEDLAQHRRLEDGKGRQVYVSCAFKAGGELDVTSYLGLEPF